VWEIAQRPLYGNYLGLGAHLRGCIIASLGDVVILGGLYVFMAAASTTWRWFEGSHARLLPLAVAGFVIASSIEYRALYLGKWSYAESMPIVPVLELGLSPLLQMTLGPVALALVSRRQKSQVQGEKR
jgi:hypothetical protein